MPVCRPCRRKAVYSALSALCGTGLIRRIEPAGSAALYEARVADNHHHVVCRVCGLIADVECVVGAAPCLDPSSTGGFVIDEAEITFWGLCPACQQAAASLHLKTASPAKENDHARSPHPHHRIRRPVADNQNSQTAGADRPVLLQDQHLIEKLAQFNRERIPERIVHAGAPVPTGTSR